MQVERLLREIAHLQARAQPDVTAVRRQLSGHHLQQRRLAGAVFPHHAPALAAANREVQSVVNDPPAVRFGDVFEHRDLLARARRRPEVEVHDAPPFRQLDLLDLVERLDPALDLCGLGGVGGKPVDEPLFLGQHRLLPGVRGFPVGVADPTLALIKVVVTGVHRDLAVVDLGDFRHDSVHELPIVRGHEQRARAAM